MITLMLAAALMTGPVETPVALESAPAPLRGTLLKPEGAITATAIIIPGSGPTDRDGNGPLGINNGFLKQLAHGLVRHGIATVRIDKRGIAESRPAGLNEAELTLDTYITDVRDWARLAMEQTGASCVWLIGHSEGALVAQSAAEGAQTPICGQILLSPAGRPAGVVIREQVNAQLPDALKADFENAMSELEAGRRVENPHLALQTFFRPSVQPYLISWLKRDPAELAARYSGPIFIGQGTTDIQTTLTDAEALHSAQPRAELKLWEGINHILTEAPADRAANIATYSNPDTKLAPQVVQDVADFILTPR